MVTAAGAFAAETPIKDVLAQIDPASGKAKDVATEFTVRGIVAAKLVLPDNKALAFVLEAGQPALPVFGDAKEAASLIPRNEVPSEPVNVFGVPVKVGSEWQLVAGRFLLLRAKEIQNVGMKRTCFTCHNPDTKLMGPPYREVAAKYRNDSEAITKLMLQMEKGGVGKWGPVPMPALGAVVPAGERKALAEWVMSYRWDAVLAE